jgi:hypothetical protein
MQCNRSFFAKKIHRKKKSRNFAQVRNIKIATEEDVTNRIEWDKLHDDWKENWTFLKIEFGKEADGKR